MTLHAAFGSSPKWLAIVSLVVAAVVLTLSSTLCASEPSSHSALEIASEKRLLVSELATRYKANVGRIRTWTGQVDLEELLEYLNDGRKQTRKSTVIFASDELTGANKTVKTFHEAFEEDAKGVRRNQTRHNQALLLTGDKVSYNFPIDFNPDAPDRRCARQLQVGTDPKELPYFFPAMESAKTLNKYPGYYSKIFFPSLMKLSEESLSKISMTRSGNLITVVNKLEKGDVLVFTDTLVFDLDRGASLVRYDYDAPCIQRKDHWECEHQQVDGTWIPRRIESVTEWWINGTGLSARTTMEWKNQILNSDIAAELSPTTLGARIGDQLHDQTTGARSWITDKDYPTREREDSP